MSSSSSAGVTSLASANSLSPWNICTSVIDYPIANVQCQYDSPSDTEAEERPAGPAADHTYGARAGAHDERGLERAHDERGLEPPAFVIHQTSQLQTTVTQFADLAPKIMTIAPGYPSVNLIQVAERPPENLPIHRNQTQPVEYNMNKRIRRSEGVLRAAADCVSRGLTFQTVSEQFNIPISTIRFFMARKGILPRRRRGRTTQVVRASSSPEPPYHMQHYKLPDMLALRADDDDQHD